MLLPFDPEKHTEMMADLHFKILGWSTNSQLGRGHIVKLYKGLAESPSIFGYVWVHEGEMVGFALGSMNYNEARNSIKSVYTIQDILKITVRSILKPLYFINAFETIFIIPKYLKSLPTRAEMMAWVTDKSHPKQRTASIQTFYALKKHYKQKKQTHFIAQVEIRSKESEAFLNADKEVVVKEFMVNAIHLIKIKK